MTEHAKARMAINCKVKQCWLSSKITEDYRPGAAIAYEGNVSCDACGKGWRYVRQEGEAAKVMVAA